MLAKRIIPTLLKRGRNLVKGQQFKSWRVVGHALQSVRTHNVRGVDELIFLDIGATPEGRGPDFDLVRELTEDFFSPVTVGGGVKSVSDVRRLLEAGADKVVICSAAMKKPSFIADCHDFFGSQCIVVSIDVKNDMVWSDCGTNVMMKVNDGPAMSSVEWAEGVEELGAGEILLTNIDYEGTMRGYDIDLIRRVTESVSIPVIAHGGCGNPQHMLEAIQAGASAVAAGAMFQFTDVTPKECAMYLQENGIEVRLE